MTYEPSLFDLEDRGYNRGTGHIVLPSGQLLACSQESGADDSQESGADEWNAVLFKEAMSRYLNDEGA